MWPQLLRLFGAVGVYVNVIIAGIAQHQRSGAAAAEGKEIEVVTAPAERNPAACTQHDGIFFIAGPAFLCIGDNCDHGGTSSHEIKDKRFHFLKHGLAGIAVSDYNRIFDFALRQHFRQAGECLVMEVAKMSRSDSRQGIGSAIPPALIYKRRQVCGFLYGIGRA